MSGIAIHGFGRIGRSTLRAALQRQLFVPASISDIAELETMAALFAVDTSYGCWPEKVEAREGGLSIGGRDITYMNTRQSLPDWGSMGIDLVIDCTGQSTVRQKAQAHLDKGARRVLVSAPSKTAADCDAVLLPGINLDTFDPAGHRIVSMASCTTNALAPVILVMREHFGIQAGFFSTVHAYTNSQSLTDSLTMRDRRDSWAAAENIIPSSSGAARALQFIWPDLNMTGKAYRVPVRTGSIAEVNLILDQPAGEEDVRETLRKAASKESLQGIMTVLEDEWALSRIVGESHSCLVDLPLTQVIDRRLVSLAVWYDNEAGYSHRLAETAARMIQG
ncbi:MAG: type I glyceraldehyde-3-phosphate dehydrogenase [Desulfohalobiaceae bacterium]|nr:type I glyceraldehyde-3-phosphate dehydrogenase [Desulfohalobiaceae bacterium]